MGQKSAKELEQKPPPFEDCPTVEEIAQLMDKRDYNDLKAKGDVDKLIERLKSHKEDGIDGSDDDLERRRA